MQCNWKRGEGEGEGDIICSEVSSKTDRDFPLNLPPVIRSISSPFLRLNYWVADRIEEVVEEGTGGEGGGGSEEDVAQSLVIVYSKKKKGI